MFIFYKIGNKIFKILIYIIHGLWEIYFILYKSFHASFYTTREAKNNRKRVYTCTCTSTFIYIYTAKNWVRNVLDLYGIIYKFPKNTYAYLILHNYTYSYTTKAERKTVENISELYRKLNKVSRSTYTYTYIACFYFTKLGTELAKMFMLLIILLLSLQKSKEAVGSVFHFYTIVTRTSRTCIYTAIKQKKAAELYKIVINWWDMNKKNCFLRFSNALVATKYHSAASCIHV